MSTMWMERVILTVDKGNGGVKVKPVLQKSVMDDPDANLNN